MKDVNKGTDFDSLVASCASFKEAGILVHAYMIYGFYSETPQDLINSMETLRQFFACGLLDSSFWHKFVLTKHSTLFSEYQKSQESKNAYQKFFVFQHFSMNRFLIDLKEFSENYPQPLSEENLETRLDELGKFRKNQIFGE